MVLITKFLGSSRLIEKSAGASKAQAPMETNTLLQNYPTSHVLRYFFQYSTILNEKNNNSYYEGVLPKKLTI